MSWLCICCRGGLGSRAEWWWWWWLVVVVVGGGGWWWWLLLARSCCGLSKEVCVVGEG